jgi:superoxide dismutase, Fe-Mn family
MSVDLTRREVLSTLPVAAACAIAAGAQPGDTIRIGPKVTPPAPAFDPAKGEYILPPLPYPANALEPHLDAKTLQVHHARHHQAHVDGANRALRQLAGVREGGDAGLVGHWSRELAFHLAGHANHCLFWRLMAPAGKGGGGQPAGTLAEALTRDFGGVDRFIAHFKAAALQVEGGGWAWLALDPLASRLRVFQTEHQHDAAPLGARPVLGIDVWEHAYYLKYESRRSAYVDAWFNVVNWPAAQALYDATVKP